MKEGYAKEFFYKVNLMRKNIWIEGFDIKNEINTGYSLTIELEPGSYIDIHQRKIVKSLSVEMPLSPGSVYVYIVRDVLIVVPKSTPINKKYALLLYEVCMTNNDDDFDYEIIDRRGQINLNSGESIGNELHSPRQIEGSDLNNKSKFPVYKFLNPWTIETPPGYSCLLVSPLNNSDKRFSIISGIVDTDTYNSPINFPFIINKKIIEDNEILIKQGTPYVQVIPFKRKNWKMKIEEISKEKLFSFNLNFKSIIYQNYKNKIWKKKNYK